MYCSQCGTLQPEGAKFCFSCGSELKQTAPSAPQPVQGGPQPVQDTPQPAPNTPQPVTSGPQAIMSGPQPIISGPQSVASAPPPVVRRSRPAQGAPQPPQSAPQSSLRGFSSRINDPAFAKYIKNSNRWSALFSILLATIAIIGFYIAGEKGMEGMGNPQALYIGLAVGGMFLLIALFQILGRSRGKTWDGTVEDKKIKKKTEKQTYSDGDVRYSNYLEYSVIIRSDQGKRYSIRNRDNDTLYNYYRVGDRVRYHARLKSYEKYDKMGDKFIPCNACGSLNDISNEYCFRCKCPLLK